MPFKSQAQNRFFRSIASGDIKDKNLSKNTAKKFIEDTDHQKVRNLPQYVDKKSKFSRLKKAMKD